MTLVPATQWRTDRLPCHSARLAVTVHGSLISTPQFPRGKTRCSVALVLVKNNSIALRTEQQVEVFARQLEVFSRRSSPRLEVFSTFFAVEGAESTAISLRRLLHCRYPRDGVSRAQAAASGRTTEGDLGVCPPSRSQRRIRLALRLPSRRSRGGFAIQPPRR